MATPSPATRALLLDLDGTLLDTAPDFAEILNAMRSDRGLERLPAARVRETVSDGARALITLGFEATEDDPGFAALHRELLERYADHLAVYTTLFPGMDTVLEALEARGLRWGVVTNKPSQYAAPLLSALGLAQRCSALVCPDHLARRKPDPEGLLLACRQLGLEPSQAIYAGDHRRDIEAGRAAGMRTVACGYGYVHRDDAPETWGADWVVQEAQELLQLLEAHPGEAAGRAPGEAAPTAAGPARSKQK